MIDLVLAGDNSIVIAMAVQSLPKEKKFKGILFGAIAAVILRVLFTFFASKLLAVSLVKLIGGLLILWIAIKLLNEEDSGEKKKAEANSVWSAVWMIIVADLTISLDNILAVAGASHGSIALLLFGLGLSIPLVIFASTLISKLMEKFRIVVWIGAIILGKVAGEMIVTDPWLVSHLRVNQSLIYLKNVLGLTSHSIEWTAEISGVLFVLVVSILAQVFRSKNSKDLRGNTL